MKQVLAQKVHSNKGFTLIEILVVIGIIAILAGIVIVAINPSRQFAQARNTQRESNVATILNAIGQNIADHKGTFTCSGIGHDPDTSTRQIGSDPANVNLGCLVPTYIPTAVPVDPVDGLPADTKYTISKDDLGRFTICAPNHDEAALGADGVTYCLTR